MTRIIGSPTWLWVSLAMAAPLNATAADEADEASEAEAPKPSHDAETQPLAASSAAQHESTPDVHWQFGVALNLLSYQRASFDLEPIGSGQPLPGYLERTNYGPSGGSVILEPGYIISNQLALGFSWTLVRASTRASSRISISRFRSPRPASPLVRA